MGIAVLQAGGKNNLDRPAAIFKALGIPTFVVWDCDKRVSGEIDNERANRALQKLLGVADENIFGAGSTITDNFACFEVNLEAMMKTEFGPEAYDTVLTEMQALFEVKERKDAMKAAPFMRSAFSRLTEEGKSSVTLEGIVERVVALRNGTIVSPRPVANQT